MGSLHYIVNILQVDGVRCRQHANPLRKELQVQLPPQDWTEKYADPGRPLIVDIGCGPGRFLLALSHRFQGHNMLGLDIREKVKLHVCIVQSNAGHTQMYEERSTRFV